MVRRVASLSLGLALASVLVACGNDRDLPEDPALTVPGMEVTPPPVPTTMPVPPTFDTALAVPGVDPLPPPPPPQMPPGMQPGQMPPGMQPGQMPPGMQPGQVGPIALTAGFVPDPQVRNGVAGGPMAASAMTQDQPDCRGFVTAEPSQVMQLASDFANLRVLVSAQQDTTLVIRGPDGAFRCNDDAEGFNPVVAGPFAAGPYTIWVGSYPEPAQVPYVIGFSELAEVNTASITPPAAPQ